MISKHICAKILSLIILLEIAKLIRVLIGSEVYVCSLTSIFVYYGPNETHVSYIINKNIVLRYATRN